MSENMAQMQEIGDLPSGLKLYYAAPEHFGEDGAGYFAWVPGREEHVRFVVEPFDFSADLSLPLATLQSDPAHFAELVALRTEVAPAGGRDHFMVRLNVGEEATSDG